MVMPASELDVVDSGRVTTPASAGTNVLNDNTKNWSPNVHQNKQVRIVSGPGVGQFAHIESNTQTTLVIRGLWTVGLNTQSQYVILGLNFAQILRDVLGGGSNISVANPLEVHDPKVGSLISYEGTTTANGAGDGSTLLCGGLAAEADFDGNIVIITSGDYQGQARGINGVTTGGTVTPASVFGGQIVTGTTFVIVGIRTTTADVAAVLADIGDASASALGSLYAILGNPAQTFLAMVGYEGATSLANKLTAVRAALLDEITAGRMSELDAANLPADIDTLLTRLSAARALLLDEITAVRLGELDAANLPADIDTLLTRVTAAVALASVCTEARLSELDAANIPADLTAITNYVDTLEAAIGAIEGATTLHNKLTAARAGYLDELAAANIPADIDTLLTRVTAAVALASVCTEARLSELAAANIPADIDTLLTRLSAARAGYLDELAAANIPTDVDTLLTRVTAAVALASVCTEVRLAELTAANMPADIDTLLTRVTAAVALASVCTEVRLAELAAANIPADIDGLKTSRDRQLFSMDFWSDPQEEVQVAQAAGTLVITPTVTVADLPGGATIVRAIAMFKFRMVENIYAGVNKLDGATDPDTSQVIQVKETAAGAYIDAIKFVDDQFTLADTAREGGDVLIGSIDIAAQVDGNDSYTFQWLLRKADQDFINFNDVQVGLRIWYSV